ncbi:MAG: STAS domain-containing protein [Gammaproteobacteria bacterium]
MKARRKTPSARDIAAKKQAVSRKHPVKAAARRPAAGVPSKRLKGGAVAKRPAMAAGKRHTITLASDCTIEHSPGLHQQLARALSNRACVTLDFAAVKRADTAGLQVLAAFIRERRAAGRDLELTGMQDNFLATAQLLGLSALFSSTAGPPVNAEGFAAQAGQA